MMQKGLSGFRRFLDVVETEPEIVDAKDAKPAGECKGHVRYEDVSFHYSDDDTLVLADVSIDIPAGNQLRLLDHREVERQQSVHCFRGSMM